MNHFDEKTLNSLNAKIKKNEISVIPVIPLFGGMEFLLSFQSYRYIRIETDNCSVINPKTAGSVSLIESILEDYVSIFTNTEIIALDMRYIDECIKKNTDEELTRFFSKLSAVLSEQIREIIIICTRDNLKTTAGLLGRSDFNYVSVLELPDRNNFTCGNTECKESYSVTDSGLEYYLEEEKITEYRNYEKNIDRIWKNIIKIKNELLKYQIFEYSVREKNYELILLFTETEKIFQDILRTEKNIIISLEGKIKKDSVCRFFRSRIKVIETELFFLKTGLDNYFIEPDNCS